MKKFIVLLWIGLLAAFLPADCAAAVKLACLRVQKGWKESRRMLLH